MNEMNLDKLIFRLAGVFILASLALGHYVHEGFYLFTAFVGLNLLQSSFTGFCPLALALRKLGVRSGAAF